MAKFTRADEGCIADGSFGHDHVRERLADLCAHFGETELAALLRADMSDDASEEDEAVDWLNAHACAGCSFELCDGDLMLRADEPDEPDPDVAFEESQDR